MADVSLNKIDGWDVVQLHKGYWSPEEINIASCFGFHYNIETNIITAFLCRTGKAPLKEFIRRSFKNFTESTQELPRRTAFTSELKKSYDSLYKEVSNKMEVVLPYNEDLFVHQAESLQEAYYKQYNFFAFEMGLGKTLTAASLSRLWQSQCTVIICPAAVKWNWYRDLSKFKYNELFFTILDSSKKRSIKGFQERFVIINYESLPKFSEYIKLLPVEHIILDEAHNLKNISTDKFKNVARIVKFFPNAKITMLSGTPIKNRVDDVYAYLKLIKHALGLKKEDFLKEYTNREKYKVVGGKNLDSLRLKLSNFMIRKTKKECLDLPEKTYISYRYELDDYREEYDKLIAELEEQKSTAAANGNIHALNRITAKAKVKGIIEIAKTVIEEGRKVVIFGGYTEPLEMLEKHFGDAAVLITGSVNSFDRDKLIQKFHNDPKCTVFLGNMIAAGVGINLTNASDVVFMNFPFTPAELYQAIDRCHRIGQKNSVNVHYTFCEESLDDYIFEIIEGKNKDINKLIDNNTNESVASESFTQVLMKKLFKNRINDLHVHLPVGTIQEAKNVQPTLQKNEDAGRQTSIAVSPLDEGSVQERKTPNYELPDFT